VGTPLIWVVDDEPFLLKILTFMLTGEGYGVECIENGQDAWARLDAGELPDLVISDLMMPGLSGTDLVRRIRTKRIDVPVLVLTARGQPHDEAEVLAAGADAYMGKPFRSKVLVARVGEMLAARGIVPPSNAPAQATGTDGPAATPPAAR
jgi:DNA-binding response OmpR family regulator